jgi:hypothetical protein
MKHKHRTAHEQQHTKQMTAVEPAALETADQTEHASEKLANTNRYFQTWTWETSIQLGILLAGIGYAWLTYQLWQSTERAVGLTREQVHIGQRAYLILDHAGDSRADVGKPFKLPVVIKNTGQTPAKSVRVQSGILIRDVEPFTLTEAGIRQGEVGAFDTLGAGQTRDLEVTYRDGAPLDLTAAQLAAFYIADPQPSFTIKAKIYVLVVLDYSDMFGGRNRTVACAYLKAGKFRVCDFLNDIQ